MRIMIKGGVWKNTEDEILKAAVMKYGLNQWARISSLLVRKSAKQCKARWYEWLDPSIKKTEWTREEDEKLLHLAKLMPTQWRTIAPIVGRTPAQCLERYDKLLDMAVSKDERYDPADDPRRLRPGEIDPNPESKPARPDPVDMDEDEKEMLSEARARLANTRGKKAKRKAREKSLEEARRLAALQKKRELKAAGIDLRGHRKRRGVDYNAEVAFEKKPAPGFFDTGEEDARSKAISTDFRPVTLEELEGRRRKDIEEALVKRDIKRQKDGQDTPAAGARAAELNEVPLLPRRSKMMLPAPQVSEVELQQIARMQAQGGAGPDLEEGSGGDATRQLLGQYHTPALMPTPARTPRTAGSADKLMLEAQNLARMQTMQTPLLGGDNPELHPSDFSGATPRSQVSQTPNPLAGSATGPTPLRRSIAGVPSTPSIAGTPLHSGMTPAHGYAPGATPMRTPMRDELGLNDTSSGLPADSKRAEKARQIMMRNELKAGLSQLPTPENEYQVVVPEMPEEDGGAGDMMEEDAADVKARRAREEEARRAAEEKKKSQVLQRHLPRPVLSDRLRDALRTAAAGGVQGSWRERAEAEMASEFLALLEHDNAKYPLKEGGGDSKRKGDRKDKKRDRGGNIVPLLVEFELEELQVAAAMVAKETDFVRGAMRHSAVPLEDYTEAWGAVKRDLIYLPSQQAYGRAASATNSDRLDSVRKEYEAARGEMEREARRASKVDEKVKVVLGGLWGRDSALTKATTDLHAQLASARVELECYKTLQEQEQRAAPQRIEGVQALLDRQRQREGQLQERYRTLQLEQADLLEALDTTVLPAQQ